MKCVRCNDAKAMKHSDLCGICDCVVAGRVGGVQTASLVPKHFNQGLGVEIEDYDHLKRVRKKLKDDGVIDAWE
jgi:hypothetical protein